MPKLGDMSSATLYSASLPGWLNMRVASEQHVPRVKETRNVSVASVKHLCLSLQILSRTTKFQCWLNWETSRGHATSDNVAQDMFSNLARP